MAQSRLARASQDLMSSLPEASEGGVDAIGHGVEFVESCWLEVNAKRI